MTPGETLRAAAARLRELADAATPGPWQTCERDGAYGVDVKPTDRLGVYIVGAIDEAGMVREDAEWIAALSPAVAEPLAAWLEQTARYAYFEMGAMSSPEAGERVQAEKYGAPLAFARSILEQP